MAARCGIETFGVAAAERSVHGLQVQYPDISSNTDRDHGSEPKCNALIYNALEAYIQSLDLPANDFDATDIQDLTMAYILQGQPLALETFRAYNKISMLQALYLLGNLKLGHYLKIPPRSIFLIQKFLISSYVKHRLLGKLSHPLIHVGVGWWLLSTIKNICELDKLPKGSPWTCPYEHVVFDGTVQSGVVGPSLLFFPHGLYWWTYIFFAVGIIATVAAWKLSRVFPHKKWIQGISVPILLSTPSILPPATPVYVWAWAGLGIFFNIYVFRKHKEWWAKYNYILSAALNVGPAIFILLQSFAFQGNNIYGVDWWGLEVGDHCPLATCPTAKGIVVDGCPVFH
ncbi:oligopeptide transporter 1 [Cinnamomum micranthum f. kanehirae]|uniref:Oligopeptide transporter 1 n=1 Tax=Cinnamomum micranthum f. kanehirae TaxID=337451 RepID=A0A443NEP9_9MAGN|nr:oligopeptide transporter 1 [Cinnamomum micranthum f. kanehirae]